MAKKAKESVEKVTDAGSVLGAIVSTTIVQHSDKKFVVKDNFKVGLNEEAQVEISHLGVNFKKWFLEKEEEPNPNPNGTIYGCLLRKNSADNSILSELGGEEKAQVTLAEIFALMKNRNRNKNLVGDGLANIFYAPDVKGITRAIDVFTHDNKTWQVAAFPTKGSDKWSADTKVFFTSDAVQTQFNK